MQENALPMWHTPGQARSPASLLAQGATTSPRSGVLAPLSRAAGGLVRPARRLARRMRSLACQVRESISVKGRRHQESCSTPDAMEGFMQGP